MKLLPLLIVLATVGCELVVHFDPPPEAGAQCTDQLDNDLDGFTDCRDPDCAGIAACAVTARCGDGTQQTGEECDDGNAIEGDACDSNCTKPRCGNGIVDPPQIAVANPVAITVPGMPSAVAALDVDSDGRLDLAVTNATHVHVLLQSGSNFTPKPPISVGSALVAIAALGHEALAVDQQLLQGGAVVRLRNRSGTLAAAEPILVNGMPAAIAVADLNGDDRLDAVTANHGAQTVTPLVDNSDGMLVPGQPLRVAGATSLAIADLDGDSYVDLVVGDMAGHLELLAGQPFGAFANATALASTRTAAVAIADLDGDDRPDILAADIGGQALAVLVNQGSRRFVAKNVPLAAVPTALATADFDGDGAIDVAVTLAGGKLALLRNDGHGTLTLATTVTLAGGAAEVIAVQLDTDARADLVVVEPAASRLELLRGASVIEECDGGAGCTATCTRQ